MAWLDRRGDIIATHNTKPGALTLSTWLQDYVSTTDPATLWEDQAAVRTVVGAIAKDVASIPVHVYRRDNDGDRTRVRDSLLARIIAQPIPRRTQSRFIEQLVTDMAVYDRWAVHIQHRADHERPVLAHLPAHLIAVLADHYGVPEALAVGAQQGRAHLIDIDDVIFDVGPSVRHSKRVTGSPRLTTLAALTDELSEASNWRSNVLAHGALVPAVIERPVNAPKWDDVSFNRFRESFSQFRRDGGQAGGTPILEDGMQLKKAEVFNPRDFDTRELRRLTLEEACLLFHYPPELIGARPGTYSNIDAFRQQKYADTLASWIRNLEDALNAGLESLAEPGEYIEFHVDAKLRGSFMEQAQVMQSATGRPWMTTNEARRMRNLPAIEHGDEIVTPLNVVVGGLASPRDTAPKQARPRTKADAPADTPPAAPPGDLGDEATERAAMTARVEAWADTWNERISAALDLKAEQDLAAVLDTPLATAELRAILIQHMMRLAEVGAWDVLAQYETDPDTWDAEDMRAYLTKAAETNAAGTVDSRAEKLTNAAEDTQRLRDLLTSHGFATIIATTFAAEALGFGRQDAGRKAGLTRKTWHTGPNPRPSHAAQNGETVDIDDVFSNGLRWPGDHFGDPDETAGCNCTVTYHP